MPDRPLPTEGGRLQAAVAKAREHLAGFDNPHLGMSPDGFAESWAAARALRQVLAVAEPENWCPPHFYAGRSTDVRGQAVFTCQMCGHAFLGNWGDSGEGYADA